MKPVPNFTLYSNTPPSIQLIAFPPVLKLLLLCLSPHIKVSWEPFPILDCELIFALPPAPSMVLTHNRHSINVNEFNISAWDIETKFSHLTRDSSCLLGVRGEGTERGDLFALQSFRTWMYYPRERGMKLS